MAKVVATSGLSIRLRTKLTLLYVALFVTALSLIGVSVYVVTRDNVERTVREQLRESGAVFANLSASRDRRLQDEAEVLARDFGFRAAFATGDRATVLSALDNLSSRLEDGFGFTVGLDGKVLASDPRMAVSIPPSLIQAVQGDRPVSGVTVLGGDIVQIVAAPVMAPAPAGWVVFAKPLRSADIAELQHLSAIPLEIAFLARDAQGRWRFFDASKASSSVQALLDVIRRAPARSEPAPTILPGPMGPTLSLALPLLSPDGAKGVYLVLSYPLAQAFRAYNGLIVTIVLIGGVGVLLTIVGSWVLALTLTRPLSALQAAARRLQMGEVARVLVDGRDEIAILGRAFNAMADDIKTREDNLVMARDLAEAASRAKSDFLSNMNHELRTPLNGVLAMASLLARDPLDERQQRMVELIRKSGAELERVLADVLSLVEANSAEKPLLSAPFHLGDLLRAACASAAAKAKTKGLAFRQTIDSRADRWVRGDASRLADILTRLLDNAVKFTGTGEVALEVLPDAGDKYKITVRDTGVGFEPGHAERLFQAFSKADESMTRRAGGLGVGLSLARQAARVMGGDITGDGELDGGASFTLVLSLPPAEAPPAEARSAGNDLSEGAPSRPVSAPDLEGEPGPEPEPGPLHILLADDHEGNRRIIELILGSLDVDVISVEDGAQAVDAFQRCDFDLVLMDLQMPVMDGLTAIRHIRAREQPTGRRTPILVVSANVQAEHLAASVAAGADGHIAKPISAPVLIAAIDAALGAQAGELGAVFEAA